MSAKRKRALTPEWLIEHFDMYPLDLEGGMVYQSYFSDESLPQKCLPGRSGDRKMCSAIIYLLTRNMFSRMHRLPTDEIFYFHLGATVEMLQLFPDGTEKIFRLGTDLLNGEQLQVVVPRGVWQGTRVIGEGEFTLLGTSMAPSFDPNDYEDGHFDELSKIYQQNLSLLEKLCGEPKYHVFN